MYQPIPSSASSPSSESSSLSSFCHHDAGSSSSVFSSDYQYSSGSWSEVTPPSSPGVEAEDLIPKAPASSSPVHFFRIGFPDELVSSKIELDDTPLASSTPRFSGPPSPSEGGSEPGYETDADERCSAGTRFPLPMGNQKRRLKSKASLECERLQKQRMLDGLVQPIITKNTLPAPTPTNTPLFDGEHALRSLDECLKSKDKASAVVGLGIGMPSSSRSTLDKSRSSSRRGRGTSLHCLRTSPPILSRATKGNGAFRSASLHHSSTRHHLCFSQCNSRTSLSSFLPRVVDSQVTSAVMLLASRANGQSAIVLPGN